MIRRALVVLLAWPALIAVAPLAASDAARVLRVFAAPQAMWLATTDGLVELDADRHFVRRWTEADGLPSAVIADVVVTRTGDVVVATTAGPAVRRGARFATIGDGLLSDDATCLFEAADGTLYLGTARGLARRSGPSRWQALLETHEFGRDRVTAMAQTASGVIWVAKSRSLLRIEADGRQVVVWRDPLHPSQTLSWPLTAATTLAAAGEERLWLAGEEGLLQVDGMTVVAHERWRPAPWGEGGLPAERIWAVHTSADGSLWLSFGDGVTHGVVARRSANESSWRLIAIAEGEPPVVGYGFAEDDDGLWLGTSRGLHRLEGDRFRPWSILAR